MAITGAVAGLINAGIQGVLKGFGIREFSMAEVITSFFAAAGTPWMQGGASMESSK